MKNKKLVLIGAGVIGRGLIETLIQKKEQLAKNCDLTLSVTAICEKKGSIIDEKGIDLSKALKYIQKNEFKKHPDFRKTSTLDVLESKPADIAVEMTPGDIKNGKPGIDHIVSALKNRMNVVTSNKSPLALKFQKLNRLAEKNGIHLKYEATVGGSIPIIKEGLQLKRSNRISEIQGVLNGTTNFILDKMAEEGVDLKVSLKEAQELGFAETDPTYDLEGIDTAAKVSILANSLLDKDVSYKDISVKGITDVTPEAIHLAKEHGYVIKLVGDVGQLSVSPRLVAKNHTLNVKGALNAIMLDTDLAGQITFVGPGAGPKETSSAILSDIIDISLEQYSR
ncbi:MAG: homoserine dehydrogenase [Candidatus Altiarchaeota archaeon]